MAYNTNIGKQSFTAIAAQTEFDFNFKIFKDTDLLVYLTLNGQIPDDDIDILILATNYTVTITGDTGGKVTLLSGASVGDTIVVQRSLKAIRETEYQTSGDLRAVVLNDDLNYQTYLIADNNLTGDNALRLSDSTVGVDTKLPSVIPEFFLRVNAAGTAFEFTQAVVQVISEVATSVFRLFDGTKKIAFDASNITSAQTRTISMADNNVDLADIANISPNTNNRLSTVHNMASDANYTLTATQNQFGRIEITDSGVLLSTTREIIMNNDEHTFLFVNKTAQSLTVKTSAGTGITVAPLASIELRNDTVNVIKLESIIGSIGAWVNFIGTGTVAIRGSGNVSSIADNGTGDYTINWATNPPDANYSIQATSGRSSSNANSDVGLNGLPALSSVRVQNRNDANVPSDAETMCITMVR